MIVKQDENESLILKTLLVNPYKRLKILSYITKPREFLNSETGLEIFGTVSDLVKNHVEVTIEAVKTQNPKIESNSVDYILNHFEEVSDNNLLLVLNRLRSNVLESDFKNVVSEDITGFLKSDGYTLYDKINYLKQQASKVEERMRDFDSGMENIEELIIRQNCEMEKRLNLQSFFTSGDERLDSLLTYGLAPGEITFVAGRPSNGKSLFAQHLSTRLSMLNIPTRIYNFEMSNTACTDRMISIISGMNILSITKKCKEMTDAEKKLFRDTQQKMKERMSIGMFDKKRLTMDELARDIEREQLKSGSKFMVIFIDLLTKVRDFAKVDSAYGIEKICNEFQEMTKSLGVHMVPLVQINREADKIKITKVEDIYKIFPSFSQIKNSGAFEEIADNILLVCRPSMYARKYEFGINILDHFRVELAKQRSGVNTGFADSLVYKTVEGCLTLITPEVGWDPYIGIDMGEED